MGKKNLRRVTYVVSAQTAWHIQDLADMERTTPGRVLDKLVRDRVMELRMSGFGNGARK